jgi:hypothetical protein
MIRKTGMKMSDRFEFTWPGMDKHMKVFVRTYAAHAGLYWFEVIVGRRVALCGSMMREDLVSFIPTLKTREA